MVIVPTRSPCALVHCEQRNVCKDRVNSLLLRNEMLRKKNVIFMLATVFFLFLWTRFKCLHGPRTYTHGNTYSSTTHAPLISSQFFLFRYCSCLGLSDKNKSLFYRFFLEYGVLVKIHLQYTTEVTTFPSYTHRIVISLHILCIDVYH